jgi:hypothetical protein
LSDGERVALAAFLAGYLLQHSPAAHVRRPRLDYESHVAGLDRNELGALLVAAGLAKDNRLPGPGVDGREQPPDAHLPGDVLNPIGPGSGDFRAQSGTFAAPVTP